MYTTLLKDALINMDHDLHKEMQKFYHNARTKYPSEKINRSDLDQFQQNYRPNEAIQWYTKQMFIYPLMNDGLRYLQGDVIADMGFFVHDLHHQLVQLQQQQSETFSNREFIVYRGQALPEQDLQKLQQKKGGLLGFNNFLSTSLEQGVSMMFIPDGRSRPGYVGVLFIMTIDPKLNKTPFAKISHLGNFPDEDEVLFGMHAVFRIFDIRPMGSEHPGVYEIELQLTADDDPQLTRLTEHMSDNTGSGFGFYRLGRILLEMNQLDKAEEVYLDLLKENPSIREKGVFNHQLGLINEKQGKYKEALDHYQTSLEFNKQILPEDDPNLASSYNNIGAVYVNMEEYPKALSYFEKSLAIHKKTLPDTHPLLAVSYKNMGSALNGLGEYTKALELLNLALTIFSKTLPSTHTRFAEVYRNMALVYRNIKDYRQALENFKKAEEAWKKAVPATHPDLAKVKQSIEEMQANI